MLTKTPDIFQAPVFCSPNASDCYMTVSEKTHGCRVSCTGLYADIEHNDDKMAKFINENHLMIQYVAAEGKSNLKLYLFFYYTN